MTSFDGFDFSPYDFLDFGCSEGGSLKYGREVLGGRRGLGLDIDPRKIAKAKAAGHDVLLADIEDLPDEPLVDFTLLFHFLEHVPDQRAVQAYINKALKVSRRFVLIKQPYFDADGYLARKGLKLYWSDWTGHPNRMTSLELALALRKSSKNFTFSVSAYRPVYPWRRRILLPVSAPVNQHHYDRKLHGKRRVPTFLPNLYFETVAIAACSREEHERTARSLGGKLRRIVGSSDL